ncbi:MAG: acylphosphatase [Candidatus Paceibacterota bacterium]
MIKHIEIGIAGRGFSSHSLPWVEKLAAQLFITGAVFSRPDGSIRITAEGEEGVLEQFAKKIEDGRIFSSTENFFVKWSEPQKRNFYVLAGC